MTKGREWKGVVVKTMGEKREANTLAFPAMLT